MKMTSINQNNHRNLSMRLLILINLLIYETFNFPSHGEEEHWGHIKFYSKLQQTLYFREW